MKISHLKLYQFRNYDALNLYPDERRTVLLGENAQGKTNILESLVMATTGRSHRTTQDGQVIQWTKEMAYISVIIERKYSTKHLEMRILKNQGKQAKVDGNALVKMGELMGILNTVLFSPEDLRLIKDGPSERRRFLDIELSQMDSMYFYLLSDYTKALRNRNSLLKLLQIKPDQWKQIGVWNERIAQLGAKIYMKRKIFVDELAKLSTEIHRVLSNNKEILSIRYHSDIHATDEKEATDRIFAQLQQQQEEDILRGITKKGVHHDDLEIKINQQDARAYASQGQQRTLVLAMKMSELQLMERRTKEKPILLLDDVLSELDDYRQDMLLEASNDVQTILTTTQWKNTYPAQVYHIQNASVQKE